MCSTYPDLINLVASPTGGNKILDVIVLNMHAAYDKAVILPPIQPDVVGRGAISDHSVPLVRPNKDKANRTGFARTEVRRRRSVAASCVAALGLFLATTNWGFLYNTKGVDAKLDVVNYLFAYAQDTFCPMEELK